MKNTRLLMNAKYSPLVVFKVDVLQSVVLRAGQNSKTAGVRWLLQQENCTWRLVTSLYRYTSAHLTPCS